jgi:hypothetical protein
MSGKTHFIYLILSNVVGMFEVQPQKIIYCYGQYQPLFDEMERTIPILSLFQGLPSKEQVEEWAGDSTHVDLR